VPVFVSSYVWAFNLAWSALVNIAQFRIYSYVTFFASDHSGEPAWPKAGMIII